MGHIESDEYWGKNLTRLVDYGIAERLNLRSVKLFTDGSSGRLFHRRGQLTPFKAHSAPLEQLY
jgi:hypothetical protein